MYYIPVEHYIKYVNNKNNNFIKDVVCEIKAEMKPCFQYIVIFVSTAPQYVSLGYARQSVWEISHLWHFLCGSFHFHGNHTGFQISKKKIASVFIGLFGTKFVVLEIKLQQKNLELNKMGSTISQPNIQVWILIPHCNPYFGISSVFITMSIS